MMVLNLKKPAVDPDITPVSSATVDTSHNSSNDLAEKSSVPDDNSTTVDTSRNSSGDLTEKSSVPDDSSNEIAVADSNSAPASSATMDTSRISSNKLVEKPSVPDDNYIEIEVVEVDNDSDDFVTNDDDGYFDNFIALDTDSNCDTSGGVDLDCNDRNALIEKSRDVDNNSDNPVIVESEHDKSDDPAEAPSANPPRADVSTAVENQVPTNADPSSQTSSERASANQTSELVDWLDPTLTARYLVDHVVDLAYKFLNEAAEIETTCVWLCWYHESSNQASVLFSEVPSELRQETLDAFDQLPRVYYPSITDELLYGVLELNGPDGPPSTSTRLAPNGVAELKSFYLYWSYNHSYRDTQPITFENFVIVADVTISNFPAGKILLRTSPRAEDEAPRYNNGFLSTLLYELQVDGEAFDVPPVKQDSPRRWSTAEIDAVNVVTALMALHEILWRCHYEF